MTTQKYLIELRDKVRSKKAPRYSKFMTVSKGHDGLYYFENWTKEVMTKCHRSDWEYWRKKDEIDWRNNSIKIDYINCRWFIKSDLGEDELRIFVAAYVRSVQNGSIRTYRLD